MKMEEVPCLRVAGRAGHESGTELIAMKREIDADLCLYLNGLTVQDVGAISPLLDCTDRRRNQQRVSAKRTKIRDPSLRVDDRGQQDFSFDPSLPRDYGIRGLHLLNQHSRIEMGDWKWLSVGVDRRRSDRNLPPHFRKKFVHWPAAGVGCANYVVVGVRIERLGVRADVGTRMKVVARLDIGNGRLMIGRGS